MAILRSLVVTLGMNSAKYRSDLDKTKKKTKTDLGEMAKASASFAAKTAGAFTALAGGMAAANATLVREQINAARVAQMTVHEYNAASFAMQQYGLTAEQLGDISKDTLEKVGEYINAGSGGLQDFADAMNMSKEETLAWARSVQGMSGTQIFQKMISDMEGAGLSAAQMSNALESMGSDLTRAIPLFAENGKEIERLTQRYNDFNAELSPEELAQWKQAAEDMDLLTTAFKTAIQKALLPAAGAIEKVTLAIARLTEGTRENIEFRMGRITNSIAELNEEINELASKDSWFVDEEEEIKKKSEEIAALRDEYKQLSDQLKEIDSRKPIFGTDTPSGGDIKPPVSPKRTKFETETEVSDFENLIKGMSFVDTYSAKLYAAKMDEAEMLADSLAKQVQTEQEAYEYKRQLLIDYATDYESMVTSLTNLDKQRAKERQEAEQASMSAVLSATESFSSSLLAVMDEQSEGYKAAFLLNQAAAFANAMIAANLAYSQVLAHDAGIFGMGAVATAELVRGLGYASAGMIAGQTLAGVFHGGGTIPTEGTYLLDGGETVYTRDQHKQLMDTIKVAGAGSQQPISIIVQGNIYGDDETRRIIETAAAQGYAKVAQDAKTNGPVYKQMRR